ncbi:MAG: hypothetical protein V4514_17595 [Pseudomonadota bacterium]|jgi:hypothetical protein
MNTLDALFALRAGGHRELEQVSAHCFHNERLLTGPSQFDAELQV